MLTVAIVRYPGSNCDIETKRYFEFGGNKCFYIWHNSDDIQILNNIDLLVLPGGFAFGDRSYVAATDTYTISPGTMAIKSPVTTIIKEATRRNIPIVGICNGFQILTQLNLLPGKLSLNKCKHFVCKKVKCDVKYNCIDTSTDLFIANSYGNYIGRLQNNICHFLTYSNGKIAGVFDSNKRILGMMPHPERNNTDFKEILMKMLFPDHWFLQSQIKFDKAINDLMFSEHISYKTTRKYLKLLHTKESWVVQGPGENAGIVDIGRDKKGKEYCIAIRIESHNHPSYIDPFEGAATGVGGILRDIFTMGARPIGILDFLRFGNNEKGKQLLDKAIEGISYYGNCVGVPNVGGNCKTHESYNTNPLVNVCCLGIVEKKNIVYGNASTCNSFLVYVGSKTGNEGINGAAMASNTFENEIVTEKLKSNVQKSDPFLEKLLLEACCEISEKQLIEGMQDMGAGGLLCASLEIIKRGREKTHSNMGCEIYMDKVPTKYEMDPCNILISESQERMLCAVSNDKLKAVSDVFKKWDLEYSVIGITNSTGKYNILNKSGITTRLLYSKEMTSFNDVNDYTNIPNSMHKTMTEIPHFLKDVNYEYYDSTVGNRTIVSNHNNNSENPDVNNFSIMDIYELSKKLVITWGETFDECHDTMKKFTGIKPLCLVNCLNFGDPKYSLFDFENTIADLTQNCRIYEIPIVGGNVSLYNTTRDKSIYPTPILVMIGISN